MKCVDGSGNRIIAFDMVRFTCWPPAPDERANDVSTTPAHQSDQFKSWMTGWAGAYVLFGHASVRTFSKRAIHSRACCISCWVTNLGSGGGTGMAEAVEPAARSGEAVEKVRTARGWRGLQGLRRVPIIAQQMCTLPYCCFEPCRLKGGELTVDVRLCRSHRTTRPRLSGFCSRRKQHCREQNVLCVAPGRARQAEASRLCLAARHLNHTAPASLRDYPAGEDCHIMRLCLLFDDGTSNQSHGCPVTGEQRRVERTTAAGTEWGRTRCAHARSEQPRVALEG